MPSGSPHLTDLHIRHRGAFACVEGELANGERVKLMRLRYSGTASRWGFALRCAGIDRYQDSPLPTYGCRLHLTAPDL